MSEKYADLVELHRLGVLQEANRLFFHPLGLAMAWDLPNTANPEDMTEPRIAGLLDARDDPEGFLFTDLSDPESAANRDSVLKLREAHVGARVAILDGQVIQPIGDKRTP